MKMHFRAVISGFFACLFMHSTLLAELEYVSLSNQVVKARPVSDELRVSHKLHPFYTRCAVINGIPIIASAEVSDYALLECAYTVDRILESQQQSIDMLVKHKVRLGIIGVNQYTMDVPENQTKDMIARGAFHDRRSRGLGGVPMCNSGEENLLNLHGDPYRAENITIHESAHTFSFIKGKEDKTWMGRLRETYEEAKSRGDYGNSYAISNHHEYFAEGVQCWFDCANPRNAGGASTREELKKKDPKLAVLIAEIYGDGTWRYKKTIDPNRPESEKKHLAGFNRDQMPTFSFEKSPRIIAEKAATQPTTKPNN